MALEEANFLSLRKKVKNLILKIQKILKIRIFYKKRLKLQVIYSDIKLSEIGGKNLFCKEIEENLLENNIDIAVHSLKDMESEQNQDLMIGAFLKEMIHRDVLISEKIKNINELILKEQKLVQVQEEENFN